MANHASPGTNLFTPYGATPIALTDEHGDGILAKGTTANLPDSVAGYATGCLYLSTDDGTVYSNTGSATSCSFTQLAPVE